MSTNRKYLVAGVFVLTFHLKILDVLIIFPAVAGWLVLYFNAKKIFESRPQEWKKIRIFAGIAVILTGTYETLRLSQVYKYLLEFCTPAALICEMVFFYLILNEAVKKREVSADAVTGYLIGMIAGIILVMYMVIGRDTTVELAAGIWLCAMRVWLMSVLWRAAKTEEG